MKNTMKKEELKLISGKALWGVICGTYALPSDEVVGEELQAAAPLLRTGLKAYHPSTTDNFESWVKTSKASETEKTFVKKVSEKLDLCAGQSWEVFQLFLDTEYSGSESALTEVLSSQRDQEAFLDQLFSFYMADRLYLLRCLRHIVANTAQPHHPYQNLFREFLRDVLDKDGGLGESIVGQVVELNKKEMDRAVSSLWLAHHLAEMQEGLATLLVYYSSTTITPPPSTFITLLNLAQGNGPGGGVDIVEHVRDCHTSILTALHATHALLLVLAIAPDSTTSGHSLCEKEWIEKVEPVMAGMGSRQPHLAPVLAWSVLQLRAPSPSVPHIYHKLAHRALTGNVFGYLQDALLCQAIQGDGLLLGVASSVVYSLVCAAASCLVLDDLPSLTSLAKSCLAQDPPAQLFWSEEGGGAGLLLPQALEVFPHESEPLLSLCTALAKASTHSCTKVVELLSELPSVTWTMTDAQCQTIEVRGTECLTTAPLNIMPSVIIPADTHGTVLSSEPMMVVWHHPSSGWQILLASIITLDQQVSSGLNAVEERTLHTVCLALRLLASVLATSPSYLSAFIHFIQQTLALLRRISQVLRPPRQLVAAIIEVLSEAAAEEPTQVWPELEGSQLLPSFPLPPSGRNRGGSEQHYQAGRLRALVCGEEAAAGTYPILTAYTHLLTAAIKGGMVGGSVRGGVVFLAREVAGPLLRWCYKSQEERDKVLDATLAPLHHTLQQSSVDKELRDLVVRQLVDQSSAGQTLLWVVVGGAGIEATLSHPHHSPGSNHAQRLTRTAQMALSILHRLVGEESSMDGLSQLLRATPSPRAGLVSGGWTGGAGIGAVANSNPPHLALTVALYAHHRLNPRLTYLALRTLTRFAQKLEVPLVACLGGEAEGVRDALLRRLDSATEDVGVKVALLRLLTAATSRQQGLTNAFLTPPNKLLSPLVTLISPTDSEIGHEVRVAVVELVDALWSQKYSTAIQYLNKKEHFWTSLVHPLANKKPGEVKEAIVGYTLRVLARQMFLSEANPTTALRTAMDKLCAPDKLSAWSKYVVVDADKVSSGVVGAWRDLLAVLVARAGSWLTSSLKVTLARDVLGALRRHLESDTSNENLTILLAELYLLLVRHCGKLLAENKEFFQETSQLLVWLQGAVMTTSAHCQVLLLAAALTVLTLSHPSHDECEVLLNASCSLAQQYGRLAGIGGGACTSPAALAGAASLMHQCLVHRYPDPVRLSQTLNPVVPALLHATNIYTKSGNEEVVDVLLSLLANLSQLPHLSDELSATALSSTLTLVIPPAKTELLSKVIWCIVWRVKEEGVGGVEGGVNVAAVHLSALCGSLAAPHLKPGLALASAALTAALAPHASLWMVLHADSQTQLTAAVARCVHLTTHLLCLPRFVQVEISGDGSVSSNKSSGDISMSSISTNANNSISGNTTITPATITRLNSMLQVLSGCLSALQCLGPELTDLLCGAGSDVAAWTLFFHPSFRRVSIPDPSGQPSLASLTSVLDLYDSHASKEHRGVSPSGSVEVSLNINVLARCAEQALLLLLTQCSLALMSPDTPPRDAIRVRHGLADELNAFFTRWLGRRIVVSPLPSSAGAVSGSGSSSTHMDLKYLRLAQQLVVRLSATK